MRPASGRSCPVNCAIKVVLPAPLGPISAWTSPRLIANDTLSVAVTPPNRFCKATVRSSASAMADAPLTQQAGNATARVEHDEDQQHTKEHGPVLGELAQQLFQEQKGERAIDRAGQRAHTAQHDNHDQ